MDEQHALQLNHKIAKALGYKSKAGGSKKDGYWAVILDPEGEELEYTTRAQEDHDDDKEMLIHWAWLDFLEGGDEYSHFNNEILATWATDANRAMSLFDCMDEVEQLRTSKYSYDSKWKHRAWINYADASNVAEGEGDTLAEALCNVFLAYKAWEKQDSIETA